jgi:hypothetical protein
VVDAETSPPNAQIGNGQRVVGLAIGGVGIAGLVAGGVLATLAKSKYNDSLPNCETSNLCNARGVSQRDDAVAQGNLASIAVVVGAAAIAGGAVLWLTAPRAPTAVAVVPTLGGAAVAGGW